VLPPFVAPPPVVSPDPVVLPLVVEPDPDVLPDVPAPDDAPPAFPPAAPLLAPEPDWAYTDVVSPIDKAVIVNNLSICVSSMFLHRPNISGGLKFHFFLDCP
jgi:hypothetical protein